MRRSFFIKILSIKLISCFFSIFIFANFTQLGDADRYINSEIDFSSINKFLDRTFFTDGFFYLFSLVFGKNDSLHFFTAALVAGTIYFAFKDYIKFIPRIFWLVLIMPSFAVWTSVVGKEAIAFCAFLLIGKWVVEKLVYGRSSFIVLVLALVFGLIVRPHYGIAYAFIILMTCLCKKSKNTVTEKIKFSFGSHISFIFLITSFLFFLAWLSFEWWETYIHVVMETAWSYFSMGQDNSSREWVVWESSKDFFINMWWGVPASLMGPMSREIFDRNILLPFFVEGVFFMVFTFYILFLLAKHYGHIRNIRFFMLYAFTPALLCAILIHYPFGIFNPGSANRYKQVLTPMFYFLPILLMAALSKKRQENGGF